MLVSLWALELCNQQPIRFSSCLSRVLQASHYILSPLRKIQGHLPQTSWSFYFGWMPQESSSTSTHFLTRSYSSFPVHSYCHALILACIVFPWGLDVRFLALVHSRSSFPLVRVVVLLPLSFPSFFLASKGIYYQKSKCECLLSGKSLSKTAQNNFDFFILYLVCFHLCQLPFQSRLSPCDGNDGYRQFQAYIIFKVSDPEENMQVSQLSKYTSDHFPVSYYYSIFLYPTEDKLRIPWQTRIPDLAFMYGSIFIVLRLSVLQFVLLNTQLHVLFPLPAISFHIVYLQNSFSLFRLKNPVWVLLYQEILI